jgi:hypothetical protein
MSDETTRRSYKAIVRCIGNVLRDRNDYAIQKPVPSGLVQLLAQLNEKERRARLPGREAKHEQPNAKTRS